MLKNLFALIFLFFSSAMPAALAATGIGAIDTPAITLKAPSQIFLIAIARAGNRLVAVGEEGAIIYSDDSGVTWSQAAVPVSATLTAIAFATPQIGWAVGHYGVILHTVDAGRTWQIQLNGVEANQLTLAAAKTAVATNYASPGTALAIRRATNFVAGAADKPFLSIWAPTSNEAIVFGAYRLAMLTNDGGKTWQDWSLHIEDQFSHNIYAATQVGGSIYLAAEAGLIFRSDDNGDHFVQAGQPGDSTLFGAIGTGNGGVIVFGVAGQAFITTDNSKTWTAVNFGTADNLTAACTLRDGAVVVANQDGWMYISHDHGTSFSPLPRGEPMAISDIIQAPDGEIVAVGSAGVLRLAEKTFAGN